MEERSKTMDEIICTDAIEMSYVLYLYIIKYTLLHFLSISSAEMWCFNS